MLNVVLTCVNTTTNADTAFMSAFYKVHQLNNVTTISSAHDSTSLIDSGLAGIGFSIINPAGSNISVSLAGLDSTTIDWSVVVHLYQSN